MDDFVENEFVQYRGSQEQAASDFSNAAQAGISTDQWMLTRNLERPAIYPGQTFPYQPFSGAIRFQPPQASHIAFLPLPDLSHGSAARYYEPSSLPHAPVPFPLPGYNHTNHPGTQQQSARHRSSRKNIHRDEDWAQHRHEIHRLYVDEDRTLQDTMTKMASEHNFHASQRTYKKKLEEWGLWKNLPLPVARFIAEKNRQREGKPTDFILFDKPVSLEKVEEAVRRSKGGALPNSNDFLTKTPTGLLYGSPGHLTAMAMSPMPGSPLDQLRTLSLEPSTSTPNLPPLLWQEDCVEDIEEMIAEAEAYVQSHNEAMAEAKYQEALSAYEKLLPPTDDRTLEIAYRLANLYANHEMMEKADEVLDQMNRKIVGQQGLSHQKANVHFLRISNMYRAWGREADARMLTQRLVETRTHTSAATPFASLPGIPVPSIQSLLHDARASTNNPSTIRSTVEWELEFFETQLTELSTVDSLMMLEPEILATMEICKQNLARLHIQLLEAAKLLMKLSDSVGKRMETEVASLQMRRVHEHSESACLTVLRERAGSLDLGTVREVIAIVDKLIELRGDRATSTVQRLLELLSCRVDEEFVENHPLIVIIYVHVTHMYASRDENDEMKRWFESALSRSMALLNARCSVRRSLEYIFKAGNVTDIGDLIKKTVKDLVKEYSLHTTSR